VDQRVTCGSRGEPRGSRGEPRQRLARLLWTLLFGVGMAFTEACIVVYLRQFFGGQTQSPVDLGHWVVEWFSRYHPWVPVVEQLREASTLVMLIAVAFLGGRSARERWGVFLAAFGVWDIFYYVWLYALIRWPPSLMTMDVLFLIPVPWVAPVLAPVVVALEMALVGAWLLLKSPVNDGK